MIELVDAYVDLQVNGYAGVDFNDPDTPLERLHHAAAAIRQEGVRTALPTVITAAAETMVTCITNIVQAMEDREETAQVFRGIHIEGPFLSPKPGFIGAHPKQHARSQDLGLLRALCDAAGNHLRILTLAPEVDPEARMVHYCAERGIIVAAGHTDASLDQLRQAVDRGLSLFTHLGNGCPTLLDRHDNIILRALHLRDRLRYTLIADGHHVPAMLFELLLQWISPERIAIVSDAISAAGLGPGTYQLGGRSVTIGNDRLCRDPNGDNFMGSASRMQDADRWLAERLHLPFDVRRKILLTNPSCWLNDARRGS